eukprot:175691_1
MNGINESSKNNWIHSKSGINNTTVNYHIYTQLKYNSMDSLTAYAKTICNVYCRNKQELSMYAPRHCPRAVNPPFNYCKYLFHSDCDWINLLVVNALFPNVQKLSLNHVQLNGVIMDHILVYLKRRPKDSQLKQILIFTKEQKVQPFMEEYAQILRPHGGYLYGTMLSTDILYLDVCTELEFVFTLINRMHHGICYKDANHQVFNLMDQLIRRQLDDTNDISDGPNQKIFNDYCLKKTT